MMEEKKLRITVEALETLWLKIGMFLIKRPKYFNFKSTNHDANSALYPLPLFGITCRFRSVQDAAQFPDEMFT